VLFCGYSISSFFVPFAPSAFAKPMARQVFAAIPPVAYERLSLEFRSSGVQETWGGGHPEFFKENAD
jgi:hypothetical protein